MFLFVIEQIFGIRFVGDWAGLGLWIAFTVIIEHERNTSRIAIAASSALFQGNESVEGPDIISGAITRPHRVSSGDNMFLFVIEHILRISRAGFGAGLSLRKALFIIVIHERDTSAVAVTSIGTL